MIKIWKNCIFPLFLCLFLIFFIPVTGQASEKATEEDSTSSGDSIIGTDDSEEAENVSAQLFSVNPLYGEFLTEDDIANALASIPCLTSESDDSDEEHILCFTSGDEASAYLRQSMVQRVSSVSFTYCVDESDYSKVVHDLFNQALEETGNPTEGDYLRYQYGGYSCRLKGTSTDDSYRYSLTYLISYYSTSEQENMVSNEISRILEELELEKMTPYEKTEAIYRYLVSTVIYDYTNLDDTGYTQKYSAYAALIDGTAICQGYATAFYRLSMEAGIPCRIIGGMAGSQSHAWNIVKLDGFWYNLDATWDSVSWAETENCFWFLKNEDNFSDHVRDEQYLTTEFVQTYPMGSHNYLDNHADSGDDASGDFNQEISTLEGVSAQSYFGYYDGEEHSISVTAPENSTITWSLEESGSYTETKPCFSELGRYTVYYQVKKEGYTTVTGHATVNILLKNPVVTLSNSASGIIIHWNAVKGATGYVIYRKTSTGWKKIKTTAGNVTSWTNTKRTNGDLTIYAVKAISGNISSFYMYGKIICRLEKTILFQPKNTTAQSVVLKWNHNPIAEGYQIQYSTDSNFATTETIEVTENNQLAKTVSKTLAGLTPGQQYYVRVRSYNTTAGTTSRSTWSNTQKITAQAKNP